MEVGVSRFRVGWANLDMGGGGISALSGCCADPGVGVVDLGLFAGVLVG